MVGSSAFLLCAAAPAAMGMTLSQRQPAAGLYSLPNSSANSSARATALSVKRAGWEYGPFLDTPVPFYPTGELGDAATHQVRVEWNETQQEPQSAKTLADAQSNLISIISSGNITKLEDYNKLYDNSWVNAAPNGPWKGVMQNYTSDLLFGMERLSTSPYSVKRMQPTDSLPFTVENAVSITGQSLEQLLKGRRLFIVDYSSFKDLPMSKGKYGGACQAYFYIHPKSGDFLPLAIKTNAQGSDLTYTPEDSQNDWLLAKILFNINDNYNQEFEHFAASHWVGEIVYLAAIRSLSEEHPLMPILHRVMKLAWAMRPAAAERLLYTGGPVDRLWPWSGASALNYATKLYQSGVSGSFQGGYFNTDLEKRGLTGNSQGPKLKSFPYHDDASVIVSSIRGFMKSLVDSYYDNDCNVEKDTELQAWMSEAPEAKIIDFPASLSTKKDLVSLLTHIAYLVSVKHGVSNTNSVIASLSLPFHPFALWAPLPTEKGVANVMPYLPGVEASVAQVRLSASFNRPAFANSDDNIIHMFANSEVLSKMNKKVQNAAAKFAREMEAFSNKVSTRTFDKNGLSQGMPFIWKALDPNTAGYWLAV